MLLVAPLTESLTVEEQAILGAFFNVLGDLLALNSSYLSAFQSQDNVNTNQSEASDSNSSDEYELLKESLQKLEKQLNEIRKQC